MHRSLGLHTKERCVQLWCGDAWAANWSNALWQVSFSNRNLWYNIQNHISIWNGFCLPLIFSERPKAEQSLVRWAKPQLKDMDTLDEMVDPALCGLYAPESVSAFADIVSICVMVCSLLILYCVIMFIRVFKFKVYESGLLLIIFRRSLDFGLQCQMWWRHWRG